MVWAHPRHGSYSDALCRTVLGALERAGHEATLLDLYAESYQPVMGRDEWRAYRAHTPVPDEVVTRHLAALDGVEQLVVVYPTWWFGMPAMLKGWLERTMLPGVAFAFDERGRVRPALGLRSIVGVTTYGSPHWYVRLIGDAGRRTIMRAVRLSCVQPWRVRTTWLGLYGLDRADADRRAAFLRRVDQRLGRPHAPRSRPVARVRAITGR